MTNIEPLFKFILSWEGGYSNDPCDSGGVTFRGITLSSLKKQKVDKNGDGVTDSRDLMLLDEDDVREFLRSHYWNFCQADHIKSPAVAYALVDWFWCSGVVAIKRVQKILHCIPDGIVGHNTLTAINREDAFALYTKIIIDRRDFLYDLVKKCPKKKKFLRGWIRRVNAFGYSYLIGNDSNVISF